MLRVIHTADWHLGQSLYGFDRSWEHARFLDWLLGLVVDREVDALLVAGDVFDSANPSAEAQRLFFDFAARAHAARPLLRLVVIAGNHDSAARLEAPKPVLNALGVHVVGAATPAHEGGDPGRLVVPLTSREGSVEAHCLAVPFLRPMDVPRVAGAADAFLDGVAAVYARVLAVAQELRQRGQALVAMGHCHVMGGATSDDSERRLVIGGAEGLPASVFADELAYVALGHLHRAQTVGGKETRRYSGSPFPMSFSEAGYQHQVVLFELSGGAVSSLEVIPVPRRVDLLRVPAQPAALDEAVGALSSLQSPSLPAEERPLVEARVLVDGPVVDLRRRVEQALTGKAVRLARIDVRSSAPGAPAAVGTVPASLDALEDQLDPDAIFRSAWRRAASGAEPPEPVLAAFREVLDQARAGEGGEP